MNELINILDIVGRLPVTTTVPTKIPKTISEQMVLYVDDKTTPTVKRLYIYFTGGVNTWFYVSMT